MSYVVRLMNIQQQATKDQKDARKNIANLAAAIRMFEPVLVNEKFTGEFTAKEGAPTIHQLINTAGNAMLEIRGFITAHEELKAKYAELSADAMIAHQHLASAGIKTDSLAGGFETLTGRIRQCYDVLHNIAHNLPLEKVKAVAFQFLAPLVNKSDDGQGAN